MDFSTELDKPQGDVDSAVNDAKQQADLAAAGAHSRWAQMKIDTAARMGDVKAKVDKRATQLDAKVADQPLLAVEQRRAPAAAVAGQIHVVSEHYIEPCEIALPAVRDARGRANSRCPTITRSCS